jgi:hypothetical protein
MIKIPDILSTNRKIFSCQIMLFIKIYASSRHGQTDCLSGESSLLEGWEKEGMHIKMYSRKIICNVNWNGLPYNFIQWQSLVLAMLNIRFLLL